MEALVTRVEMSRYVVADPTSVALLLAEPADEDDAGGLVVTPPRRAGVGFSAAAAFTDGLGRPVVGEVIVEPSTDAGCEVRIRFSATDRAAVRGVERAGSSFLDVLAARARSIARGLGHLGRGEPRRLPRQREIFAAALSPVADAVDVDAVELGPGERVQRPGAAEQ